MNLKIIDSYKITNLEDIYKNVVYYYKYNKLDKSRSIESYVEEWYVHNLLYNLGIFKSHTKDTDLDGDESKLMLICYKIIFIGGTLMNKLLRLKAREIAIVARGKFRDSRGVLNKVQRQIKNLEN